MRPELRARWGISLFFATNGALYTNLLPRLPEVKRSLELSNASFGVAVACFALGSVCCGSLPAVLMRRFGPLRQAFLGTALLAMAIALVGWAPSVWVLALLLFAGGFMDGTIDPAQNVHGLRVQRAYGRSIINSLHALWSLGATAGGLVGALAIRHHVPLTWHLVVAGVVVIAVAALATWLARLPGEIAAPAPASPTAGRRFSMPRPVLLLFLGVSLLAICGTLVEDIGNNWSALYLVQVMGRPENAAGTGFVALIAAQTVGRFLGDPMTDRFGRVRVARLGGVLVAAGFLLCVGAFGLALSLLGLALAGFGCATLVPAAFAAADDLPGLRSGTGITLVGLLMRIGFLATSPLVGMVSQQVGLRWAMLLPALAGWGTLALAGVLRGRAQA